MKRILAVTTALCFAFSSLAIAQPGGGAGNHNKLPPGANRPGPDKPGPGNGERPPPPKPGPGNGVRPPSPKPGPGVRPPPRPNPGVRPPVHRPPPKWSHRPKPRPTQWWHRGHWFSRIRGPVFHYPPGWHYRSWLIGQILPALFLSSTYYYDGYAGLGLQAPARGYRWVRYGPDLLLVNLRTGEIEDVVNSVFY